MEGLKMRDLNSLSLEVGHDSSAETHMSVKHDTLVQQPLEVAD